MPNRLSESEYIDIICNNTNLPFEICEKIISYIYTYSFQTKAQLKKAISEYPDNTKTYGDCNLWDVSNIKDMSYLFLESKFNYNISDWNVSQVTDMSCMFKKSKFNNDIGNWDISNVRYTDGMFYKGRFNFEISNWNNKNIISSDNMFDCSCFTGDRTKWDIFPNGFFKINRINIGDSSDDDSSFDENSDDYFNPYHNDKCEKKGLGLCCKENLKLKPIHPEIREDMSLEETLKLTKIIQEKFLHFDFFIDVSIEKCMELFILNSNNANIIIKKLYECSCCEHHKINKPKHLNDIEWKKNIPLYKVFERRNVHSEIKKPKCSCACRHYSRIIQSVFSNKKLSIQ